MTIPHKRLYTLILLTLHWLHPFLDLVCERLVPGVRGSWWTQDQFHIINQMLGILAPFFRRSAGMGRFGRRGEHEIQLITSFGTGGF